MKGVSTYQYLVEKEVLSNLKVQWKRGQLTEQEYFKLCADMIKKRGSAVLTIKKSNIVKPVEVEHQISQSKAEINSKQATTAKNTYRKDSQPDEEIEI